MEISIFCRKLKMNCGLVKSLKLYYKTVCGQLKKRVSRRLIIQLPIFQILGRLYKIPTLPVIIWSSMEIGWFIYDSRNGVIATDIFTGKAGNSLKSKILLSNFRESNGKKIFI